MDPPSEFPFPYRPYQGQKELMTCLYQTLEAGNCAVIESPTGTGKTMSLLCGAMKWLVDKDATHKIQLETVAKAAMTTVDTGSGFNWFQVQASALELRSKGWEAKNQLDKLVQKEQKMADLPQRLMALETALKEQSVAWKHQHHHHMDLNDNGASSSADPMTMEAESESENTAMDVDIDEKPEPDIKIIYTSRTHSQLAQVVEEVKKSPYANIRMSILSSRFGSCVNPSVKDLPNLQLVNDTCKELREEKSCKKRCPYLQNGVANEVLQIQSLVSIMDLEDLVIRGQNLPACPYYASRKAMEHAQLILVPYNTLLHMETREASGLNLKNAVIIIDEAHNLLDTVRGIYSQEIFGSQLLHAHKQISQYLEEYRKSSSPETILVFRQLLSVVTALLRALGGNSRTIETVKMNLCGRFVKLHSFLSDTAIGNIDLVKLVDECNKRKLALKLHAFTLQQKKEVHGVNEPKQSNVSKFLESLKPSEGAKPKVKTELGQKTHVLATASANAAAASTPAVPPPRRDRTKYLNPNVVRPLIAFIKLLVSSSEDSEIMILNGGTFGQSSIKFVLLNPAAHFGHIAQNARSVILAGGTMSPMSEFTDQLLVASGIPRTKITCFTTGHVVPPQNICPIVLSTSPSGVDMEFTYKEKVYPDMMLALGQTILELMPLVPEGMVIFLPSYDYKDILGKYWTAEGIMAKMAAIKQLYFEPRQANQIKPILKAYEKDTKHTGPGAALFAVIGGKMSEGINFKDNMGRCVVVVGLPYANLHTNTELQLRMQYLDRLSTGVKPSLGDIYYEGLCMKQVNQCIGRAVRHIGDYASMILIDTRYQRGKTMAGLSMWVQEQLRVCPKFHWAKNSLEQFYTAMSNHRT